MDNFNQRLYLLEHLHKQKTAKLNNLSIKKSSLELTILDTQKAIDLNNLSKDTYSKAIDIIYDNSIGELERIINLGLGYVFFDKNYKINFEIGDRVNKTLSLTLIDHDTGLETNLKSGVGAGVRSVVSITLLMYYLLSKKSFPILFLDESYSQVSAEYVERFFTFIRSICDNKDFIIVLITHDPRFVNYCDKEYRVLDGKVFLVD